MPTREPFRYEDEEYSDTKFVTIVPSGISDTQDLLRVLAERLRLPTYFGYNWNALSDCLRDLHWVKEHDVVIVHEDVPTIGDADLAQYVGVLAESVESWKVGEEHRLSVIFPRSSRERILRALGFN